MMKLGDSCFIFVGVVYVLFNDFDQDVWIIVILSFVMGEDGYEVEDVFDCLFWNMMRK